MKTEEIMAMMQRAWDTGSEQIFYAYRMGIQSLLEELVAERDDLRAKLEQAEPVAYFMNTGTDADPLWEQMADEYKFDHESVPMFAAPVQPVREPLTDTESVQGFCTMPSRRQYVESFLDGVRYAEAAHGITKD